MRALSAGGCARSGTVSGLAKETGPVNFRLIYEFESTNSIYMKLSRRKASLLAVGLAAAAVTPVKTLKAQSGSTGGNAKGQNSQQPFPDKLVEQPMRQGFPVDLPLLPDGSAPEHNRNEAGEIDGPLMWRTSDRKTPAGLADYRQMAIRVETRGLAKLRGTLKFSDLQTLPEVTHTYLLQCGAAKPRGVVTWTGVRFDDFCNMLGLRPGVHYCRFTAADGHYVDEDMTTLRNKQVMLAWLMNGQPIPADHGAPLRLVIPFRYGNRSIKGMTSMLFATPGLPPPA
jgi:DMSO/TMAO reductase YedYZ molybdopterin-dependent catalytic subunit